MLQWTGSCFRAWHWWEKAAKSPSLELRGPAIVQGRHRLARNSGHFIPRTRERVHQFADTIGLNSHRKTGRQFSGLIETWRCPARIVRFSILIASLQPASRCQLLAVAGMLAEFKVFDPPRTEIVKV